MISTFILRGVFIVHLSLRFVLVFFLNGDGLQLSIIVIRLIILLSTKSDLCGDKCADSSDTRGGKTAHQERWLSGIAHCDCNHSLLGPPCSHVSGVPALHSHVILLVLGGGGLFFFHMSTFEGRASRFFLLEIRVLLSNKSLQTLLLSDGVNTEAKV